MADLPLSISDISDTFNITRKTRVAMCARNHRICRTVVADSVHYLSESCIHRQSRLPPKLRLDSSPFTGGIRTCRRGAAVRGRYSTRGALVASRSSPLGVTMSITIDGRELYPGRGLSVSQLLHAAKMNLFDSTFNGRCVRNLLPSLAVKC